MLQNTFTTTSKFSCIGWCTLGRKPTEHPPPHMLTQVRKHGIHTRLSFTTVNMPQKLVLGAGSELLLEAISGNTVVSVNHGNWALLIPKPWETVPFQSLELKLAQLLYAKTVFLRIWVVYLNVTRHHKFSIVMKGLYQGPHTPKQQNLWRFFQYTVIFS